VSQPLVPLIWAWLPVLAVRWIMSDSFAKERERQKLEPFCAARSPTGPFCRGKPWPARYATGASKCVLFCWPPSRSTAQVVLSAGLAAFDSMNRHPGSGQARSALAASQGGTAALRAGLLRNRLKNFVHPTLYTDFVHWRVGNLQSSP